MSARSSLLSAMALLHLHPLPLRRLLPPNPSPLLRRHPLSKHRQHLHPLRLLRLQLQLQLQLLHLRRPQPQLLLLLRPPPVRFCRRLSVVSSAITDSMPLASPEPAPMVASLAPM